MEHKAGKKIIYPNNKLTCASIHFFFCNMSVSDVFYSFQYAVSFCTFSSFEMTAYVHVLNV